MGKCTIFKRLYTLNNWIRYCWNNGNSVIYEWLIATTDASVTSTVISDDDDENGDDDNDDNDTEAFSAAMQPVT